MDPARLGKLRQIKVLGILSFAIISYGSITAWPLHIIYNSVHHKDLVPVTLTNEEISWMVSCMYLGSLIAPIPVQILITFTGRKMTLLYLSVLPLLTWILVLFAKHAALLYLARFCGGIWAASVIAVAPLYFNEITEPKLREWFGTYFHLSILTGLLFQYIFGQILKYEELAVISFICPVCFITFFWSMPQTPHWLSMKAEETVAERSLAWLRGEKLPNSNTSEEMNKIRNNTNEQLIRLKMYGGISSKGHRKLLIITIVLSMAQRFSGINSILAYLSITLPNNAIGIIKVSNGIIVLTIIWTLCTLLFPHLIGMWGSKALLLASTFGCFIGTAISAVWFFLDQFKGIDTSNYQWVPFLGFTIYIAFYSIGLGAEVSTEVLKILSARERPLAAVLITTALSVASFLTTKLYLTINDYVGIYLNYVIYSISSLGTYFFVRSKLS